MVLTFDAPDKIHPKPLSVDIFGGYQPKYFVLGQRKCFENEILPASDIYVWDPSSIGQEKEWGDSKYIQLWNRMAKSVYLESYCIIGVSC